MQKLDYEAVIHSLLVEGCRVDIRGEGASRFVFARNGQRAVEISACDQGIWVEYWDDDNDNPKFNRTFGDTDTAVTDAKFWLSGKAGYEQSSAR